MIRILYVDDEPDLLEIAKFFLEDPHKFTVDTSTSAKDMLNAGDFSMYDAIVSDYQMPGMDGITFLKEVRSRIGNIPFILFTGRGREEVVIEAINNGADFYLQKGGDPRSQFAELKHKIKMAVERKRTTETLRETSDYLEKLIGFTNAPIIVWDSSLTITRFNHAFSHLTGIPVEEAVGKKIEILFPEVTRADSLELIRRAIFGSQWETVEIPFVHTSGEVRHLLWNSASITDPSGKISAIIAQGMDITERKRAEVDLQRSHTRVQNAMDAGNIAWWEMDCQTGAIICHENKARMLGFPPEQFSHYKDFTDLLHPEDYKPAMQAMDDHLVGIISQYDIEYRIKTAGGDYRWFRDLGGISEYDESGKPKKVTGIVIDLTERKLAEKVLQTSEDRLSLALEATSDGLWDWDLTSNKVFWSPRAYTMLGYTPDEFPVTFEVWKSLIHPDEQDSVEHEVLSQLATGGKFSIEFRYRMKDGSWRWVLGRGKAVAWDHNRKPTRMVGTHVDLTERKQAEKILSDTLAYNRTLIEASLDPLVTIAEDGKITDVNAATERVTGFGRDDMIGTEFCDYFTEPDRAREGYQNVFSQGSVRNYPLEIRHKDGSIKNVLYNASVYRDTAGQIKGVFAAARDITERLRTEVLVRERDLQIRALFENIPVGMFQSTPEGKFLFVNPAIATMMGYSTPEEIIEIVNRTSIADGLYEDPSQRPAFVNEVVKKDGTWKTFDNRYRRKDGSVIDAILSFAEYPDPASGKQYLYGFIQDVTDQKRRERELAESEAKFRAIVEASPTAMYFYHLDADHNLIFIGANPAADRIIAISHLTLMGKTLEEAFPNLASTEIPEMFRNVALGRIDPQVFEMSYKDERFSGTYAVSVFRTGPQTIAVDFIDITDRKKAEEALQESEELFGEVINNANDAIFLLERSPEGPGRYILVNDKAAQMLGYSKEELLQMTPRDIVPVEIQKQVMPDVIKKLLKDGHSTFESAHRRKDGSIYPIEVSTHTFRYKGMDVDLSIARDITERKHAVDALQESEDNYRRLFEAESDAIFLIDNNSGRILQANESAAMMYGYSREELLDLKNTDLSAEAEMTENVTKETPVVSEDIITIPLRWHRKKNGTRFPVEITGRFFLHHGQPVHIAAIRDISEKVRFEETLSQANRQLNLLSTITRHDINNKTSIILGYLGIAQMKFTDPALGEYFEKMESATRAIGSQIEFTKVYQDLGSHEPQWQELDKVIFRSHAPAPIPLHADVMGIEIYADPMLEKVFFNLFDNSIRHGQRATEIKVSSSQSEDMLTLVWEDDGVGIHEGEKEKIFERGFGKNTGLGMFLVQEILSLTGIGIKEIGVSGKGVRFEITVPKGMFRFTDAG